MSRLWNSFKIAFSMYSKIPMPKSDWTKENMRYAMVCFPFVGIVIGFVMFGWLVLCEFLTGRGAALSQPFVTIVLLLIPVAVTGGIHLDGLLDVSDAMASWQEKEKRLEILKDSHAGAFAVITCAVYFLFSYGVYTMVNLKNIAVIALGFVLSRTLSALSVVTFPLAKNTGLAATFSDGADKKKVRVVLLVYLVILIAVLVYVGGLAGFACLTGAGLVFWYYHHMSVKFFGGITGDLAGYFLQMCELAIALAVVLSGLFS